jgi:putative transposase
VLAPEPDEDLFDALRSAESIGRQLGDGRFLARIERQTGRVLKPAKRGPKPQREQGGGQLDALAP